METRGDRTRRRNLRLPERTKIEPRIALITGFLFRIIRVISVIRGKRGMTPRRRGSYGIDAPYVPAVMAVGTLVVLVMAILSRRWQTFLPVTFMLAALGFYVHTTLRGKFVMSPVCNSTRSATPSATALRRVVSRELPD